MAALLSQQQHAYCGCCTSDCWRPGWDVTVCPWHLDRVHNQNRVYAFGPVALA